MPPTPGLVSVILTVYNDERFLPGALDSLLAQTYSNLEVILINDGSADRTPQIIDEYAKKDTRVKPFHRPRQGRVASLNDALAQASGEFVAPMDSDDWTTPERLQRQVIYMHQHPEIGLVGSFFQQVNQAGDVIKTVSHQPLEPKALKSAFYDYNPFCHGSILVRRTVLEQVGPYRPAFATAEDYDLMLRLLDRSDVGIIPEVLYHHRLHNQSFFTASKRLSLLQMKNMALHLAKERKNSPDKRDELDRCGTLAEQEAYAQGFLRQDLAENKRHYAMALFEQGKKYYQNAAYRAATAAFKQSLALNPLNLRTWRYLGKVLLLRQTTIDGIKALP